MYYAGIYSCSSGETPTCEMREREREGVGERESGWISE